MTKVRAEIQRTDDTIFVSVRNPNPAISSWTEIGEQIATDISPMPAPEPEPTPTIDELFAAAVPYHIQGSRWGRYIIPGPASRVVDNTIFCYHNPCDNFWNLRDLSKGIFRDLGIRVSKRGGTWLAHIPIRVLTDQVFVASGLAAVERTLMKGTGNLDPVAILDEIRERQFRETQDGIRKVKFGKKGVKEAVKDAVGAIALFAAAYVGFVVGGV